jgi:hypothetical protein
MHRSSESIGTIAGGAGQGAGRTRQSGEIADRDHPLAVSKGGGTGRSAMPRSRGRLDAQHVS